MKPAHCLRILLTSLAPLMLSACATQHASSTGSTVSAPTVSATHATRPSMALPDPTEAEREAGIQVTRIATTAQGGLVDARFKVLDPAKANTLFGNMANAPVLIAGEKPPLMAPHHAIKGTRFAKDQVLFILYPNSRSAVQPGTPVMVAMGSTRLGPVTAQ